jgi:UDP-2,4-diacetamido-2,4,6-trideoxy-beta-L-altropyranose hydrolase
VSNKNILIRADSSSTIGTGHIMRDLVLAKQYRDDNIIFATQNLDGNINHKIVEDGYDIEILKSNEIEEIDTLVKKYNIDMIIIDHYGIDWRYEKELKIKNPTLFFLILDDTYERHYCGILINHNISADEKKYEDLVPFWCELRCGAEYALIRDEFIDEKKKKKVFLAMGGADHSNINTLILNILGKFKDIEVSVVTTTANQNLTKLRRYISRRKWITLYVNSNKIAKIMKRSDFAIVTPSVTLNEVVYMELPFIAIKTADNQDDMYNYLVKNNYPVLEKLTKFNKAELTILIDKLLEEIK